MGMPRYSGKDSMIALVSERVTSTLMTAVLFCLWLLLSGTFQTKFLIYGILTAVISAWVSYPLLLLPNADATTKYFVFGVNPVKLVIYFFWLMWQLVLANVDVLKATVRSEIEINPRIVRFRYKTDNPMAMVILANSITLTPGTVTIDLTDEGVFYIHALTDGAAEGLNGGMQKMVAWLFGEQYDFEMLGEDY